MVIFDHEDHKCIFSLLIMFKFCIFYVHIASASKDMKFHAILIKFFFFIIKNVMFWSKMTEDH